MPGFDRRHSFESGGQEQLRVVERIIVQQGDASCVAVDVRRLHAEA